MAKKLFRRKQYIIKPIFQLKISAIIVITLLLATFITASFLYINILNSVLPEFSSEKLMRRIEVTSVMKQRQITQYPEKVEEERILKSLFPKIAKMLSDYERGIVVQILQDVNKNLIPWILVLIALILSAGIFLTHRIAGPIYQFEKMIDKLRSGDLATRVHLRWSDEFKNLANLINEATSSLDKSTSEVKVLVKKIKDLSKNLTESVQKSPENTTKIKNLISETEDNLAKLEKILGSYKTTYTAK